MKGIICYYSGSGNTKLALQYLSKKVDNVDFELFNIIKNDIPDFSKYNIVGFATFADFGAPPKLMYSFMEKIEKQNKKNAFVFNTFGFISGKTLKELGNLASKSGFNVHSGFSLHTPENYPPMRKMGRDYDNAPNPKELQLFDNFINDLKNIVGDLESGRTVEKRKLKSAFIGKLLPSFKRTQAKKDFGIQNVNEKLCNECGVCMKGCPYEAITMNPKPIFDHDICAGCWYCYNHCKQKAIFTPKFSGDFQYPKTGETLRKKLK